MRLMTKQEDTLCHVGRLSAGNMMTSCDVRPPLVPCFRYQPSAPHHRSYLSGSRVQPKRRKNSDWECLLSAVAPDMKHLDSDDYDASEPASSSWSPSFSPSSSSSSSESITLSPPFSSSGYRSASPERDDALLFLGETAFGGTQQSFLQQQQQQQQQQQKLLLKQQQQQQQQPPPPPPQQQQAKRMERERKRKRGGKEAGGDGAEDEGGDSTLRVQASGRRGPRGMSQYKGVCITRAGKWRSVIYIGRKQKYLGVFDSEKEAARAYDSSATHFFGAGAKLNFCDEDNSGWA